MPQSCQPSRGWHAEKPLDGAGSIPVTTAAGRLAGAPRREERTHRLVGLPERLASDRAVSGLDAQAVLALGDLALLAEEPVAQYINGAGVVRAVDDLHILTAAHLAFG